MLLNKGCWFDPLFLQSFGWLDETLRFRLNNPVVTGILNPSIQFVRQVDPPPLLYNAIFGVKPNSMLAIQTICMENKMHRLEGVFNSHLGSSPEPYYICVITNRVMKRFRCIQQCHCSLLMLDTSVRHIQPCSKTLSSFSVFQAECPLCREKFEQHRLVLLQNLDPPDWQKTSCPIILICVIFKKINSK